MKKAISAAIIRNKKILLVRKKQIWILPGGKPKARESDIECLCREFGEELPEVQIKNFSLYREFEGITPHKKYALKARIYFADMEGTPRPSAEILESGWFGYREISEHKVSEISRKIINSLKEDNYL